MEERRTKRSMRVCEQGGRNMGVEDRKSKRENKGEERRRENGTYIHLFY